MKKDPQPDKRSGHHAGDFKQLKGIVKFAITVKSSREMGWRAFQVYRAHKDATIAAG
jgi:hypothetical protein